MKALTPLHLLAAGLASLLPAVFAVSGDNQCSAEFCVTAINHNNATTSYDLTVTAPQVGWIALGFGHTMANTPIVLLWKDTSNGNTVVSQRKTTDYIMPTVDPSPPRVASALDYRAVSNSSATAFSFSVPSTTETRQTVIFAWSKTPPSGNSVDATIIEHDVEGQLTLNLANPLPDSIDGPTPVSSVQPTATSIGSGDENFSPGLTPSQRAFAAHGILLSLVFLVILPFGALQARYLRTFVPGKWWFMAHWILQWPLSALLIIIGFSLAADRITKIHGRHFDDGHQKWGLAIICMYIFQCCLGGFIHFIKSKRATMRPPQNYAHAVIGLAIIGLSFWQVYTGLNVEWPRVGGVVPQSVWTWWKVWMVMIPILYAAGLVFLPRQYKMEAQQRKERTSPLRISAPKMQDRVERRYSYSA